MNRRADAGMERVNRIWNHSLYQEAYQKLQELEQERPFCGHSLEHFLDVARLVWIYNLEEQSGLDKECIYAAALLHDIGRYQQYMSGKSHHEASAEQAKELLPQCGFSDEETEEIVKAVRGHRQIQKPDEKSLGAYLYRADKQVRNCFECPAKVQCKWPEEKKNLKIIY